MTLERLTAKKIAADEVETLVKLAVEELSSARGLHAIVLFGSAASGEMDDSSDIDMVLIFKTVEETEAARRMVHQLRKRATWPMDLLCVDIETYRAKREIGGVYYVAHREGKIIFGGAV